MIDYALHYAREGWPVFPLIPGDKTPLIPREKGGHGCHDATTSAELIEQWWTQWPEANIGLATGIRSNLLVVDVDPKSAPEHWRESINNLRLPPSHTVRTPGKYVNGELLRGWHIYFEYPNCKLTIGAKLLPGVDWRGEGGYVVAPPSSVDGRVYEVVKRESIAKPPPHLIALLQAASRKRMTVERNESGGMVIANGQRNDKLFRMGCQLRRNGVSEKAILGALHAINDEHCGPPLPTDELRLIAESCARYEPEAGTLQ